MKQLLLIITLLVGTIANASITKPLPWDKPLTKSYKVYSPISEVDVWYESYGGYPYGYLMVEVTRPFAYNICEYTTIQVWVKTRFRVGGGFGTPPVYQWIWNWMSFGITIPANEIKGNSIYILKENDEVDANTYMSPGYLEPCN
jgi:hypothetical protein